MQKNFFRAMQAQKDREKTGNLKDAVRLFLESEGHTFSFQEEENKFIVERNMLSLDIITKGSFAESIKNSLENIYPQKKVREIKQIDDYQIEIYI